MKNLDWKSDGWRVLLVILFFAVLFLAIAVGVHGAKTADNGIPPSQPPAVDWTEGLNAEEQASYDAVHEQWLKSQQAPSQPAGEVATPPVPHINFDRPRVWDGPDINWCRKWWC